MKTLQKFLTCRLFDLNRKDDILDIQSSCYKKIYDCCDEPTKIIEFQRCRVFGLNRKYDIRTHQKASGGCLNNNKPQAQPPIRKSTTTFSCKQKNGNCLQIRSAIVNIFNSLCVFWGFCTT
jgi:hypothetical protein